MITRFLARVGQKGHLPSNRQKTSNVTEKSYLPASHKNVTKKSYENDPFTLAGKATLPTSQKWPSYCPIPAIRIYNSKENAQITLLGRINALGAVYDDFSSQRPLGRFGAILIPSRLKTSNNGVLDANSALENPKVRPPIGSKRLENRHYGVQNTNTEDLEDEENGQEFRHSIGKSESSQGVFWASGPYPALETSRIWPSQGDLRTKISTNHLNNGLKWRLDLGKNGKHAAHYWKALGTTGLGLVCQGNARGVSLGTPEQEVSTWR